MERLLSRREIFQKLPLHKPSINTTNMPNLEASFGREPVEWSRRDFLKFVGGLGTALSLGEMNSSKTEATLSKITVENSIVKLDQGIFFPFENLSEIPISDQSVPSYALTAVETSLLFGTNRIVHKVFEQLGIPEGNKSISREDLTRLLRDKPIETLIVTGVLGPIGEEWLFRLIPSELLAGRSKEHRWDIGIPTSVIFALIHNARAPISVIDDYDRMIKRMVKSTFDVRKAFAEPDAYAEGLKEELKKVPSEVLDTLKQVKFVPSVPMTQFLAGLFFWYLMREKGFDQVVFAHSTNNALAFTMGKLLLEKYPPQKVDK